jgi:hypothetical protein
MQITLLQRSRWPLPALPTRRTGTTSRRSPPWPEVQVQARATMNPWRCTKSMSWRNPARIRRIPRHLHSRKSRNPAPASAKMPTPICWRLWWHALNPTILNRRLARGHRKSVRRLVLRIRILQNRWPLVERMAFSKSNYAAGVFATGIGVKIHHVRKRIRGVRNPFKTIGFPSRRIIRSNCLA